MCTLICFFIVWWRNEQSECDTLLTMLNGHANIDAQTQWQKKPVKKGREKKTQNKFSKVSKNEIAETEKKEEERN